MHAHALLQVRGEWLRADLHSPVHGWEVLQRSILFRVILRAAVNRKSEAAVLASRVEGGLQALRVARRALLQLVAVREHSHPPIVPLALARLPHEVVA